MQKIAQRVPLKDEGAVREALAKQLKSLSKTHWTRLRRQGWVRDLLAETGATTLDEMAAKVRQWRNEERACRAAKKVDPREAWRVYAISLLGASEARQRPELTALRRSLLGDEAALLEVDEVPSWIDGQAKKDGEPRLYASVELSRRPTATASSATGKVVEYRAAPTIEYPMGEFVGHTLVRLGGALDQLRQVADRLAEAHGWQPAQAVAFILTDVPPVVPTIQVAARWGTGQPPRLTLTVDPEVPPSRVLEAYMTARQDLIGKKRAKPLDPATLELAAFAGSHPEAKTAGELWCLWNDEHPTRRLEDRRAFATKIKRALAQLGSPRFRASPSTAAE